MDDLALAERAFLDASIAVWRSIDKAAATPEGYQGLAPGIPLRVAEREAWERYRDLLDAAGAGGTDV